MAAKHLPNPTAIRQWVAAVGLVAQAEEIAKGATSVDRATALIVADTAAETALGLISSFVPEQPSNTEYGTYLRRAQIRARLPASVTTELQAIHKLRNGAVHQAAEVGPDDMQRALLMARHLIDTYVPRVLRSARALNYGAGIADAVSQLLMEHPIAYRLASGSHAVARHDDQTALEHCAAALHLILIYAEPSLPAFDRSVLTVLRRAAGQEDREEMEWKRNVEDWVVPTALGLTPSAYSSLRQMLPFATYIPGSTDRGGKFDFRRRPEAAAAGSGRKALEMVSQLALRLWFRDSLRYPTARPSTES